jgi:hypothetical protein
MDQILLLSADVVDSAAYKSAAAYLGFQPSWVAAFKAFYEEVPLLVTAEVANAFFEEDGEFPEVVLWKALGDELVFLARPSSPRELELITFSFLRALEGADRKLHAEWGFNLHGVAWTFEEGGQNISVRFRELESKEGDLVFDLIGPEVDLGFRLVPRSPRGGLLVTEELKHQVPGTHLRFTTIGEAELKGVAKNPYPLIQLGHR